MTEPPSPSDAPVDPANPGISLDEVVLTAAGLEGAEREGYLLWAGASAPQLVAEARRRILAASVLADSFLEIPAAGRLAGGSSSDLETEPPVVGVALPVSVRYELGEQLGAGGMGRVVKAFDRQLGRVVALKFLAHNNPAVVRFFLREARAQARVEHPHVLDIYDSGEIDGEPYIAMPYMAGGTLADVGPSLSIEGRVRLLIQAAEGLHAAHREGLLHRDVKPSNILVHTTAEGELEALVGDFGLATELGDNDAANAGAAAGSPHYIAPERLDAILAAESGLGQGPLVDRRSDIYSLGITMYQLFTGTLPFSGHHTVEILRQSRSGELPRPRLRLANLPAELEAITVRCTARDPNERYATARAVAADLRRYLDGEVVEAYAAGLAYRLTRLVLRNKLVAGIGVAAAVAMLVASLVVAVFALRAEAARERAEVRQGQAEELIRFMVVDLRQKLDSLGRLDILDAVGKAALEYFEAVPEAQLSEAELERRAQMLYQIGEVKIRRGDLVGAVTLMEESLALAERLSELAPANHARLFALGQSQYWAGFVHWELGNLQAARGPFEAYLEISRRLVAHEPTNLVWQRELSYAHSNLGSLLQAEGDPDGALAQFLATLAIDQALVAADPSGEEPRSELAATHNTVGVVLQDLGRLAQARVHLEADLEIREALAGEAPGSFRNRDLLGSSHGQLGIQLLMEGRIEEASRHFAQMHQVFTDLVAHDPTNTGWRLKLAWAYLERGRVAFAQGDLGMAGTMWQLGRAAVDNLPALDPTPPKWRRTGAVVLYHLALLESSRGDVLAARATAQVAVQTLEELATALPSDRSVPRWLSHAYLLLGRIEDTPPAARAAFERAEQVIAPLAKRGRDGRALTPWADALSCLGRVAEAQEVLEALRGLGYAEPDPTGLCPASGN